MRNKRKKIQDASALQIPPVRKMAYSRKEAALVLGVSVVTIDRLTKEGTLNPSRATRRPIYPIWELERFLRDTKADIWAA